MHPDDHELVMKLMDWRLAVTERIRSLEDTVRTLERERVGRRSSARLATEVVIAACSIIALAISVYYH